VNRIVREHYVEDGAGLRERGEPAEDAGFWQEEAAEERCPGEDDVYFICKAKQLRRRLLDGRDDERRVRRAAAGGLAGGAVGVLLQGLGVRIEGDVQGLRVAAGMLVGPAAVARAGIEDDASIAAAEAFPSAGRRIGYATALEDAHCRLSRWGSPCRPSSRPLPGRREG
jgi:hypothetical protein